MEKDCQVCFHLAKYRIFTENVDVQNQDDDDGCNMMSIDLMILWTSCKRNNNTIVLILCVHVYK
jgi:hypothetical protein